MSEKRTEFRIPLMARVDVLWGDEDGTPRVAPATLEDTSHRGMSVRMKNAIRVGSHVTVKWGSEQDSGTVTNCRREKDRNTSLASSATPAKAPHRKIVPTSLFAWHLCRLPPLRYLPADPAESFFPAK